VTLTKGSEKYADPVSVFVMK